MTGKVSSCYGQLCQVKTVCVMLIRDNSRSVRFGNVRLC
jgi:hypothetical protein